MDSRLRGKDGYGRVLQRSPEGERFKAAARGGEAGGEGAHKGRPYGRALGAPTAGYSSLGASQMVWYWLPVMAAANSAVSSSWSSAMTSSNVFDISG